MPPPRRDPEARLTPGMTILEVLSRHRPTEAVFRRYEALTGDCLLCHALFDSLAEVAARYHLDVDRLLADLEDCLSAPSSS